MFCIPKEKAEKFRKAIKAREIDMEKFLNLPNTEDRIRVLSPLLGDEAKTAVALIEQKLILKDKLQGLKNALAKIGQFGKYDPAKQAEIEKALSDFRAKQRERIFNPNEEQTFLGSLAEKVLGTEVSQQEAKNVFELTSKEDKLLEKFNRQTEMWTNQKDRMEYGLQKMALENYIKDLKGENAPLKELLKDRYFQFRQMMKEDKLTAAYDLIKDAIRTINDTAISLVASVDNSFQFRQGFKTLVGHPTAWFRGFRKSWSDMGNTLRGKKIEVRNVQWAEIYSNPNYITGRYKKMGILPATEEQFPTSLPERIPIFGRFFSASERAFVGSALRMRTGVADIVLNIQKKNGANIDDTKILKGTGDFVNSMTARGRWGKMGEPSFVRLVLWAPRMLKSAIDTFTYPFKSNLPPGIRKQAAISSLSVIAALAAIKGLAMVVNPQQQELDPRATDFKNIKFGNTRFSFGIGEMSLLTLASRLVPTLHDGKWGFWFKNSAGVYQDFSGKYGERSPFDMLVDFLANKTTPTARALVDYLRGRTFKGEKPTWATTAYSIATPIQIQNTISLKDDASANAILGVITEFLGASAQTYQPAEVDWNINIGKELQQFKAKVGQERFDEANNKFNQQYGEWLKNIKNDSRFRELSEEKKQQVLSNKKTEIKEKIWKEYGFKYKLEKSEKLPKF